MKTIFALFPDYHSAQAAVGALHAEDYDSDQMNLIMQAEIAKDSMHVDRERIKVEATDELGEKTAHGLDAMLAGEQPVNLPGIGDVFAAGELATILVRTSAAPGASDGGLKPTLIEFSLPENTAEAYRAGVASGHLLFFIRTPDERAAAASDILKEHQAENISGLAG